MMSEIVDVDETVVTIDEVTRFGGIVDITGTSSEVTVLLSESARRISGSNVLSSTISV